MECRSMSNIYDKWSLFAKFTDFSRCFRKKNFIIVIWQSSRYTTAIHSKRKSIGSMYFNVFFCIFLDDRQGVFRPLPIICYLVDKTPHPLFSTAKFYIKDFWCSVGGIFHSHRRIQNSVQHLRWSLLRK